jgi:adenosylcobinamide-GDP ribazoletransferase
MWRLTAALKFLTVLPVPSGGDTRERDLAGSLPFFPVVGLLIGALVAALALGLGRVLPPLPAAALIVIALVAVSGGLHLDGLSDSADGFFSSRPRERILEIMRDSRAGPMGIIAIVSVMGLKFATLASTPEIHLWSAVFLMPIAGRCALVVGMASLPYARPEGGLGSALYKGWRKTSAGLSILLLVSAGWIVAGWAGLIAAGSSVLVTLLLAAYTYHKIGGATGDTLGAGCEIAEVVPALTLAVWHFVVPG